MGKGCAPSQRGAGRPGCRDADGEEPAYADFDAVRLQGVGHYPMLERPAEFNARLREVLAEMVAR